jgi:hypothetical protein
VGNLRCTLHVVAVVTTALIGPALAQLDPGNVDEEIRIAARTVFEGRVNEGLGRLDTLLGQIDPSTD